MYVCIYTRSTQNANASALALCRLAISFLKALKLEFMLKQREFVRSFVPSLGFLTLAPRRSQYEIVLHPSHPLP